MKMRLKGFTLIELLIVVAIIAILAAIAVPNLLEAQVRSKVSRVKADMRSYATAIESYAVDNNDYPPFIQTTSPFITKALEETLIPLSTPIAYMTDALIPEPFNGKREGGYLLYRGWDVLGQNGGPSGPPPDPGQRQAIYAFVPLPTSVEANMPLAIAALSLYTSGLGLVYDDYISVVQKRWFILSPGPDTFFRFEQLVAGVGVQDAIIQQVMVATIPSKDGVYDPTNGTVSVGEIVRNASGFFNDKK